MFFLLRPLSRLFLCLLGISICSLAQARLLTDIEYGRAGEVPLLLDVHVPEGQGPFPVAILVHGGGWASGDKSGADRPNSGADISPWFDGLSDKFVWFSINYGLAPEHRWPACLEDTFTAIRWVKAHAADYGGDPARVAMVGHSSGGHLVAMAAALGGPAERVQAVVGCAPVTSFEQDLPQRGGLSRALQDLFDRPQEVTPEALAILRGTQPINLIRPGLPPFLLVHGSADRTVPLAQSIAFQQRLQTYGVPCDLLLLEDAPHRLTQWNDYDPQWLPRMAAWMERTLAGHEAGHVYTDAAGQSHRYHALVAADGSGTHRTVQAAIDAMPPRSSWQQPWIVLVQPGTYRERLQIGPEKHFLVLRGIDAAQTVITYDLSAGHKGPDGNPIGTGATATVRVDASDVLIEDLTLENSFGVGSQALALRLEGDRAILRRCRLLGHQDTLLSNTGRHYFEDCYIAGTVDYIFGGATAYFERCVLHSLSDGYITAASTPQDHPHGYVFHNCRVTAETPEVRIYFGRPWRDYAAVTFLHTQLPANIRPEGWHNWRQPAREQTSRYFEHASTGPGADKAQRVPWAHTLSPKEAAQLTPLHVLGGADGWNPFNITAP
ncbi:MAG: pectinesterase family protein [Verrucomicrobiota bacterium JB022]|nr:pectinesterase family protein [Verrucomicrobiota bacterium JB022]